MTAQCPDCNEPDDDSGPHDGDADTHDGIRINLDPEDRVESYEA
ncbi:hypothetical protein [Methanospirillum lacunae]|nr:hypothetical protein [Methanospirillum lacunae]